MELMIETQCWENYGTADVPYWKAKGGDTIIVTDVPNDLTDKARDLLVGTIEVADAFYVETVTRVAVVTNYRLEHCRVIPYADLVNTYIQRECSTYEYA